jgi:hypothetical protein
MDGYSPCEQAEAGARRLDVIGPSAASVHAALQLLVGGQSRAQAYPVWQNPTAQAEVVAPDPATIRAQFPGTYSGANN